MFVRAANPIWFFNNLIGQVLDDRYYAFFLTNDLPYIPQPVYQDPNGFASWPDPLEFQPSGGLPNNLYFDPTLVYRIEIREGPTQTSPLIWLIQNFIPAEGNINSFDDFEFSQNLITDPQFADIFFSSPATITIAGTYQIAPGWQLILTGTGSTTLTQLNLAGSNNIAGNPPFALQLANSGWSTAMLVQQFNFNGALFANGSVAMSLLANPSATNQIVTLNYETSDGTIIPVATESLQSGIYSTLAGAVDIGSSTNIDTGSNAFTQMQIVLQPTETIILTNVQFLGQAVPLSGSFVNPNDVPPFQEISYERTVDHEFHVYRESIIDEPKNSIAVGWQFAVNPFQYWPKTGQNVAANQYTADQTIIIQQNYVNAGVGNNVFVGQAANVHNDGIIITAVTATNQFAILQYIDPITGSPYWNNNLSSMVTGLIATSVASTIKFKARLIYIDGLPSATAQHYPIASWAANGEPVFASGVNVVIPENDPVYTFIGSSMQFPFNSFPLPAGASSGARTMGLILYTLSSMSTAAPADSVIFNDISLIPNDFAMPSNAKTADEVLRECQFFWEKSYDNADLPGTITTNSLRSDPLPTIYQDTNFDIFAGQFNLVFNTKKRSSTPIVNFYSPMTGASNAVDINGFLEGVNTINSAITYNVNFVQFSIGSKAVEIVPITGSALAMFTATASTVQVSAQVYYHFTADTRLGI